MRASIFSAAVAAALAFTAWTPSDAQAQVVVYPASYTYPVYSYGHTYNYPNYQTWSSGWTNSYPTTNWSWYQTYPAYTGYTNSWYGSRYWGVGYRGYRRW